MMVELLGSLLFVSPTLGFFGFALPELEPVGLGHTFRDLAGFGLTGAAEIDDVSHKQCLSDMRRPTLYHNLGAS
jgi:hypothetical protein